MFRRYADELSAAGKEDESSSIDDDDATLIARLKLSRVLCAATNAWKQR